MLQIPSGLDSELSKFPPKLRKLAEFVRNNPEYMSLKEYCEQGNVNYDTVRTLISRSRKKGNDFNELLTRIYREKLGSHRSQVFAALVRKTKEGSLPHMRLYFELTGDLKPDYTESQSTHNTQHNYIIMPPVEIPESIAAKSEEPSAMQPVLDVPDEQVIDVEDKEING